MGIYVIIELILLVVFKRALNYGWFALFLSFLGLYLLKKSLLMNSDSSLWLSVFFIGAGFSLVLSNNLQSLNSKLLLLLSISLAIASLIVYIVWKNEAHLYLFITTIISVVPTLFFAFKLIGFMWFVLAIVLVNILNFLIYKIFASMFR